MRSAAWFACMVVLSSPGCRSTPSTTLVEVAPESVDLLPPERPDTSQVEWVLREPNREPTAVVGRFIGVDRYACDDLPEHHIYEDLWVVTITRGEDRSYLAFVFDGTDDVHGIAMYQSEDHVHFDLMARTLDVVDAYDWAVAAPDGSRLYVWGRPIDEYERSGTQLIWKRSVGAPYFKSFPQLGRHGQLAARIVDLDSNEAVYAREQLSRVWDKVTGLQFDESGDHVAYVGRRGRKDVAVLDCVEHGPFDRVLLHKSRKDDVLLLVECESDGRRKYFEWRRK